MKFELTKTIKRINLDEAALFDFLNKMDTNDYPLNWNSISDACSILLPCGKLVGLDNCWSNHLDFGYDLLDFINHEDKALYDKLDDNIIDYLEEVLGVITLNSGKTIDENRHKVVIMKQPTIKQYELLEEWLDYYNEDTLVYVRGYAETFSMTDYTGKNIVDAIKHFFVSGVFAPLNETYGYRTEDAYGSGIRNLRDVIEYEIVELGNTDIPDTLIATYSLTPEEKEILNNFIDSTDNLDYESSEEDLENIVDICMNIIHRKYPDAKYCLWLADKNAVKDIYAGNDTNIDTYEIPTTLPISDLGYDGQLYVYNEMPHKLIDEALTYIDNNKSIATMEDGTEFNIWTECDSSGSQLDCMKIAYTGDNWIDENDRIIRDNVLGYLQYAISENEPDTAWIQMIEVKPNVRRKGIATRLIQALKHDYKKIEWGYTTDDGTAFRKAIRENVSVSKYSKILDQLDKEFGQCDTYMWSTYILPNGHFLNPDNSTTLEEPDYEHSDFIYSDLNPYGETTFETCLKMNVTYPYIALPEVGRWTPEQQMAFRKIINNGWFDYEHKDIQNRLDASTGGHTNINVFDMKRPLMITAPFGDTVFDMNEMSASDIVKEINKGYIAGTF